MKLQANARSMLCFTAPRHAVYHSLVGSSTGTLRSARPLVRVWQGPRALYVQQFSLLHSQPLGALRCGCCRRTLSVDPRHGLLRT